MPSPAVGPVVGGKYGQACDTSMGPTPDHQWSACAVITVRLTDGTDIVKQLKYNHTIEMNVGINCSIEL